MSDEKLPGVSVHTGFPNPATDKNLHTLDLNELLVKRSASTYFFRIEGNEWQDSGIFNGDIAVIDRSLDPRKNDIVVWWDDVRGEFAITTFASLPINASVWGVITSTIHQLRSGAA